MTRPKAKPMRRFFYSLISLLILATQLPADPYCDRRDALRRELGEGILIVRGSSTVEYDLKGQRSDFLYLTGLDQPEATLVLLPGGKRLRARGKTLTEILYLPKRDPNEEQWTGEKLGPGQEAEEEIGVENVFDASKFPNHLAKLLKGENILYLSAEMANTESPLTKDQRWINNLLEHNPFIVVKDLKPLIESMRQIKTPEEIALIRKAIEITGHGLLKAIRMVAPEFHEYQVESVLLYHFRFLGGDGPAFDPIVGSGSNSTILHYSKNERRMKAGELLVIDAGARYRHYTADITRTVPVSGKFSDEQAEIYDIVLEAQRLAIEEVKPGAVYREDIDATARHYIEEKGYGQYFIHGTGHFVGLDVHDGGDYQKPLEPGIVLTVEPGIYIPDKAIGVRIEDMVLVTEEGNEVLSREIPRTRSEIEEVMRKTGNPTP